MLSFKFKKAVQALNYFASMGGGQINYMKAIKLVWLSDRAHLRTYGRTITNDKYVAMKNGPVPSNTKDIVLKSLSFEKDVIDYYNIYLSEPVLYNFKSIHEIELSVFSQTDLKIMERVYIFFKNYDEFSLSEYSHHFPEWKRYESELKSGIAKFFPVIEDDFFENGELISHIFSQSEELLNLSKKRFNEVS